MRSDCGISAFNNCQLLLLVIYPVCQKLDHYFTTFSNLQFRILSLPERLTVLLVGFESIAGVLIIGILYAVIEHSAMTVAGMNFPGRKL